MQLATVLSVLGPLLTTLGAGLLAFDVLRGPARQLLAEQHAERLVAVGQRRDDKSQSLVDTQDERSERAQTAGIAAIEAKHASTVDRVETAHSRAGVREQARAFRLAIAGLLLVAAGGVAQAIAAVLMAMQRPA